LQAEAVGLAQAINLEVSFVKNVVIDRPKPSTLLRGGFLDELKTDLISQDIALVYIDKAITPIQQRNLEKQLKAKVIDRTGLILEIFGARASTFEGRLQVELAALSYQKSRLVRSWTHLERQRGGFGFLGGPGESQIELDRRMIIQKIVRLKADLEKVKKTRMLHRKSRQKVPYPVVALVGYTNAGKSSLFNKLTGADTFVKDLLFATLDPTMRLVALPSGKKVILSDTVGFISQLPTHLVAAFRATLEEVIEADVIVHVRDLVSPMWDEHANVVLQVLSDLGIAFPHPTKQFIEVFNKIDLIASNEQMQATSSLVEQGIRCVTSAVTGQGLEALLGRIDDCLKGKSIRMTLLVSHEEGGVMAWLHENGVVHAKKSCEDGIIFDISFDEKVYSRGLRKITKWTRNEKNERQKINHG
ncbi:MAG: GTPase HflX, partial [Alphaproteobacteria bacterium]|nr:GTPase HflX [Alphaproteobacteria bacterium]